MDDLRTLYFVGVVLHFGLLTCVSSQNDAWFSLNGTTYQNNSIVTLEDIGENSDALHCRTSVNDSCNNTNRSNSIGNWFFPNGTKVPSESSQWSFYRDRGEMQVVCIHRSRGGEEGIYRCEIPDSFNVTHTIYIGLYTANTSSGSPTITCLTFDDQSRTLTCTSTGGPATNVTWRRDGVAITLNDTYQQTKRLVDPVMSTYQTVLTIDPTVCQIEGTYSCTVQNVRGESSKTVVVPGRGDVWFSLNGTTYQNNSCVALEDIGECDTALLCRTNSTDCCNMTNTSTASGNWFFPNGTRVPNTDKQWDFYRSRGQMVVQLHRRRGGVEGIYHCKIPDSMNVTQTIYIGMYSANANTAPTSAEITSSPTVGTIAITRTIPPRSLPPSSSIQLETGGAISMMSTAPVCSSTQPINIPPTINLIGTITTAQPPPSDGATTTIQPTNNPSSDGTTTTSVIIVVAVVIILVVIVVGVVILVVIFRAKKRKQQLVINKLENLTEIEMKLKQESASTVETSSIANQPPYAVVQAKAPPSIPSKSEELMECLRGGYSEIKLEPDDSKYTLPAKPPRQVNLSDSMSEEMESSPVYQDVNQHCVPASTTSVPQETDTYTVPDTTSSHTTEAHSRIPEVVYSEPIQPSLFTDAVRNSSSSDEIQPYAPIYTIPINMPKSEEMPLKVSGSNIREIHELGMGQFGKVILAETVGLSAKDLRLSEADDDKSKLTVVAVKKLKSDAPNATKDAFEKEVNFMSRLSDGNVIRILGVCYEDTPFIMMEYMEKGDLNQYLQKFQIVSTTDSEPPGQIKTSTLVHMTTQIASAMKYLSSHNFVHRDLATRNCLVGPNYLVKISDFGMSRSLYDSHYYRIHGRFALPVRWMAFECFYGKFSQKSDVWGFGVTMWEIFTLAKEQPYNDMSDKQVVEDALKGKNRKILAKPDVCPVEVYRIMLECWAHNSKRRATFQTLFQLLTSFQNDE